MYSTDLVAECFRCVTLWSSDRDIAAEFVKRNSSSSSSRNNHKWPKNFDERPHRRGRLLIGANESQAASRSVQPFLQGSPTDRPRYSVGNNTLKLRT